LILYTYTGCRYIVDGNVLFLAATETARWLATSSRYAGIIAGIGYPSLHGKLYDRRRRSFDPTLPQQTSTTARSNPFMKANNIEE